MKTFSNKLWALSLILLITGLTSCKVGMTSESKGKVQEAYLQFIQSQVIYPQGVEVVIDTNAPFTAVVNKQTKMGVRGNVYTIPTGRHTITVKSAGETILHKEIFTTSQETKQIILP